MAERRGSPRSLVAAVFLLVTLTLAGSSPARVTQDEMYALWGEAASRFEAPRTILPSDSYESLWVERVAGLLIESWPDRRWVTHSFIVVDDPAPRAWSFPVSPVHHRIYVSTGLLEFIRGRAGALCDDQLAGVLGHEMAHLMRDHHLLRHRRAQMLALEIPEDLTEWPARVLGKWQKEDEFEADRYGAFYALHAGYRFDGIVHFLAHYMRRYGDDQLLDSVGDPADRSHPSLSARIAQLQQERRKIEDARPLFACGLDLLRAGAWNGARACFAQVRNTFVLSPTVAHNLAYAELKQYEASLGAGPPLEQCVSTSYSTELRIKGPELAAERALLVEAKADFMKACALDEAGGFVAPRLGLACVYLYERDEAKAQISLQEVQVGSDEPGYLNLTGVLAERRGDVAAAQRAYCKALNLAVHAEPEAAAAEIQTKSHPYLPALYNLARLLEVQEHYSEASQLYAFYLKFEGSRSPFGTRARDGLLRCGGRLPQTEEPEVIDSYRGIDLRSSGPLVVQAALGEPEARQRLVPGRSATTLYQYPSEGITVLLAPGTAGDQVVFCITLSEPNRDAVAGVYLGDSAASLEKRLGRPRAVATEPGDISWWDYARYGLAFRVEGEKVQRCLIGGRR